jgi:hypothetical protein
MLTALLGISGPGWGIRPIGRKLSVFVTFVKPNLAAHDPAEPRDAPSAPPAACLQ